MYSFILWELFNNKLYTCVTKDSHICTVLISAKVAVELGKHDHDFIHAGVLLHPAFTTVDDIKGKISVYNIRVWIYLRIEFTEEVGLSLMINAETTFRG